MLLQIRLVAQTYANLLLASVCFSGHLLKVRSKQVIKSFAGTQHWYTVICLQRNCEGATIAFTFVVQMEGPTSLYGYSIYSYPNSLKSSLP